MPRRTTGRINYHHERSDGSAIDTYQLEYILTAGSPPHGPTYSCGGYPGDPDECEIVNALCVELDETTPSPADGRTLGKVFLDVINEGGDLYERIAAECFEDAAERWAA